MKKFSLSNADANYAAPSIEMISLSVEQGFAQSTAVPGGNNEPWTVYGEETINE
ncbi:MAG: hypothetical protein RSB23_07940 [Alistipes sp.]